MKLYILLIMFCSNLFCSENTAKALSELNYNQRYILVKTFYDSKEFVKTKNERLLLTAIAWKESNFGEKLESKTNDFGVFQINLKSFNSRFGEQLKSNNLDKYAKNMLRNNHKVGMMAAVAELNFWKQKYPKDLDKVIASYNDGSDITQVGKDYATDIKERIAVLDSYLKTISSNNLKTTQKI
mgnify:CR=1 FL=1